MNQAAILYENVARVSGNTLSYSGSEVEGFEYENSYDWRDFSLFRAAIGTTELDITVGADTIVDSAAVWFLERVATATITLQLELTAAVFTTVATFSLIAGTNTMQMSSFNSATVPSGQRVRWLIAAGAAVLDIRQLCVGRKMVNPVGQYVGQTPLSLLQGVVTTNIIAINGSVIGRNYRRVERRDRLEWQYLTPAWVRSYWQPFTVHAARNAFFYLWAPTRYPAEVAMATAESIEAPSNSSPPPFMSASMPLLARVGETSSAA
jgi:hypothetical protein